MARKFSFGRFCRIGTWILLFLVFVHPAEPLRAQASPTLLNVSDFESPLCPYGYIAYTLALTNPAGNSEQSVVLTDSIPTNTLYVEGSVLGGADYNSGTNRIEWDGSLEAGEQITITFVVTVGLTVADGTVINNSAIAILQDGAGGTTTLNANAMATVDCTKQRKLPARPISCSIRLTSNQHR
jgi:uncharacterized repeat protein (TIGR01451 family)